VTFLNPSISEVLPVSFGPSRHALFGRIVAAAGALVLAFPNEFFVFFFEALVVVFPIFEEDHVFGGFPGGLFARIALPPNQAMLLAIYIESALTEISDIDDILNGVQIFMVLSAHGPATSYLSV
jgi:hypothetical protein